MAPNGSIWRAKHTFFSEDASGTPVRVDEGDLLREGHELVSNNPGAFEAYEPKMRFDVEDASADPGRKRGESRAGAKHG